MIHYEYYFFLPSLYIINNGCLFNKKKWPAPKGAKCDSFSFNFLKHTILLHILSLAISTEFRNQVRIPTSLLSCAGCNIILRSCNNPNVMTCYSIYFLCLLFGAYMPNAAWYALAWQWIYDESTLPFLKGGNSGITCNFSDIA